MKKIIKVLTIIFGMILTCNSLCYADMVAPTVTTKDILLTIGVLLIPISIIGVAIIASVVVIVVIASKNKTQVQNKGDNNGK